MAEEKDIIVFQYIVMNNILFCLKHIGQPELASAGVLPSLLRVTLFHS